MIKGVNRQVLEIKDTGCEYFTQALFFVDPKFSTLPEKTLREKAEASLKDPPGVPVSKKQKALKIILKITKHVPLLSRITSYSISFQPAMLRSIRH